MKRNLLIAICISLAAAFALPAQSDTAEIYGGYAYAKVNPETPLPRTNMNGWVVSPNAFPARWFGVGMEISAVFGDIGPGGGAMLHAKEYSYLAGPQIRFVDKERFASSVRILLGGAFAQANYPSAITAAQTQQLAAAGYAGFNQTKFAMLFAAPVDVGITKRLAWRVEAGLYMTDFNKTKQANFRFSTGPVLRFGSR